MKVVKVNNSSGSVSVTGLTCKELNLEVSSGSLQVKDVTAESSFGNIKITNSEGALDLAASSGSLRGTAVSITGDSSFQTSSGAIDFDFTNTISDFTFNLESSSGLITAGQTRAKGRVTTGSGTINIRGKSSSGSQSYR